MSKNKNKPAAAVDTAATQAVVDPAPVVEAPAVEITQAPEVSVPPIDPAPVVESPYRGDPEYAAALSFLAEAAIKQGVYGLARPDIYADLRRRDPSVDELTLDMAAAMVFERARDGG